jgi:WD40 repeat protein
MASSPNDRYLVTTHHANELLIWDLNLKKLIDLLAVGDTVVFSPDGKTLATLHYGAPVELCEFPSLKSKGTLGKCPAERADYLRPSSIAYSLDGKRIACAGLTPLRKPDDPVTGWIKVWEVESGKELASFDYPEQQYPWGIVFTEHGKALISICDDTGELDANVIIRLWSIESGKEVDSWKIVKHGVRAVAISRDGKRLVTKGPHQILLWDLMKGKRIADLSNNRPWSDDSRLVVLSPDGKTLAVPDPDRIALIDTQSGKIKKWLRGHEKGTTAVTITNDGKTIISAGNDSNIKLWDMPD